jgi:hypothetical protein
VLSDNLGDMAKATAYLVRDPDVGKKMGETKLSTINNKLFSAYYHSPDN